MNNSVKSSKIPYSFHHCSILRDSPCNVEMTAGINQSCSFLVHLQWENGERKREEEEGRKRQIEGGWRGLERVRETLLLNIIYAFKSNYINVSYIHSGQIPISRRMPYANVLKLSQYLGYPWLVIRPGFLNLDTIDIFESDNYFFGGLSCTL